MRNVIALLVLLLAFGCKVDVKEWVVIHDGAEVSGAIPVGVGLTTRIYVTLDTEAGIDSFYWLPDNLVFVEDQGISVAEVGLGCFAGSRADEEEECIGSARNNARALDVFVDASGTYEIDVLADNIDERKVLTFDAQPVTGIEYTVKSNGRVGRNVSHIFAGSTATLSATYFGASDAILTGTAPFFLAEPVDAADLLTGEELTVGDIPRTLEIASAAYPERATVHVVLASDIADIKAEWPIVRTGSPSIINLTPTRATGAAIFGSVPEPYAVTTDNGAIENQREYSFTLVPEVSGTSTLSLTWGSAAVEFPVPVSE